MEELKQKEFSPFKVPHRVEINSVETFKGVKLFFYEVKSHFRPLELDDEVSITRNGDVIGTGKVNSLSGMNAAMLKLARKGSKDIQEVVLPTMWSMSSTKESSGEGIITVRFFQDFEVGDIIEALK